jgi:DNA-binding NarL/FixJ family response regulator
MRRILLAGDHALVRQRLRQLVEEHCEVMAEATDAGQAGRLAFALRPDIAIVDFGSAASAGLETTRRILTESPSTTVIVLSVYPEEAYVSQARSAGAAGFVLTDSADSELVRAIDEVSHGGWFVSPAIPLGTVETPNRSPPARF